MLSELDQVPLLNSSAPSTLHTHLFPITPVELGEGFVIGTDKVLTKVHNNLFPFVSFSDT